MHFHSRENTSPNQDYYIMRKAFIYLLILSVAYIFVSCNNEEPTIIDLNKREVLPETEVYFQGQKLFSEGTTAPAEVRTFGESLTRADYPTWPYHTDEGWESARFYIRSDGTVPDFYDKSTVYYFGRVYDKPGINTGKVSNLYYYPHYNDRNLDYYQKIKETGDNIGLFRYVYDPKGLKTQPTILEAPLVADLLTEEAQDLEAEIAAGRNVGKNEDNLNRVNDLLALGSDYLESHVLWYVVKEVGFRYAWHVDGIINDVETPKFVVEPLPDNVEVDVHQQEHTDWFEVKTSIHVRTDAQSVKVIIPLKEEDILENDDFDIRVYDVYYKEYIVKHNIRHDAKGITIEITDIPADMIAEMKSSFGDGITIEVYSYCKQDVWEDLKKSRVQTGKPCNVEGQASSALRPGEKVQIYVEQSTK